MNNFDAKIAEAYGAEGLYITGESGGVNCPTVVTCPDHGEFETTPAELLYKRGCKACRGKHKRGFPNVATIPVRGKLWWVCANYNLTAKPRVWRSVLPCGTAEICVLVIGASAVTEARGVIRRAAGHMFPPLRIAYRVAVDTQCGPAWLVYPQGGPWRITDDNHVPPAPMVCKRYHSYEAAATDLATLLTVPLQTAIGLLASTKTRL